MIAKGNTDEFGSDTGVFFPLKEKKILQTTIKQKYLTIYIFKVKVIISPALNKPSVLKQQSHLMLLLLCLKAKAYLPSYFSLKEGKQ